jgi:hypothetical protein
MGVMPRLSLTASGTIRAWLRRQIAGGLGEDEIRQDR